MRSAAQIMRRSDNEYEIGSRTSLYSIAFAHCRGWSRDRGKTKFGDASFEASLRCAIICNVQGERDCTRSISRGRGRQMRRLSYTSRFQRRAGPLTMAPGRSDLDFAGPIERSLGHAGPGFGRVSLQRSAGAGHPREGHWNKWNPDSTPHACLSPEPRRRSGHNRVSAVCARGYRASVISILGQ